jgi:hypothetical protein
MTAVATRAMVTLPSTSAMGGDVTFLGKMSRDLGMGMTV